MVKSASIVTSGPIHTSMLPYTIPIIYPHHDSMHRITTTLMLLAAVLLTPLATMAQEYDHEEVIEDRFDIGNGDLLTIDSDLGSIEIVGGNGSDVFLTVIKGVNHVSDREADRLFDRFDLDIRESSRGLEIIGDYDKPSGRTN